MGADEKSNHRLEPQDKFSRVPNFLAFILYRILLICGSPAIHYMIYLLQGCTLFNCDFCFIFSMPILFAFGMGVISNQAFDLANMMKEASSSEESAAILRKMIEDYETYSPKYPFGFTKPRTPDRARNEILYQKERVAACLAGSRRGIPPSSYRRESVYLKLLCIVALYGFTPFFCGHVRQGYLFTPHTAFSFCIVLPCSFILWLLFTFQVGKWFRWNDTMCVAVRTIKTFCNDGDLETGGDSRKELQWWIEAILTEESDTVAVAQERKEVIIDPILRMIRC